MTKTAEPQIAGALKACPFCGGDAQMREGHRDHWRVECGTCLVTRREWFARENGQERAITAWNTRLAAGGEKTIEILRRALAWHGDPQRMATTREEWQQEIDEAILWVKQNPEPDRPSFSTLATLSTLADRDAIPSCPPAEQYDGTESASHAPHADRDAIRGEAGWQDISSAPKGTSVLVVVAATELNTTYPGWQAVHQAAYEDDKYWLGADAVALESPYWAVTHWRPLPLPPKLGAA